MKPLFFKYFLFGLLLLPGLLFASTLRQSDLSEINRDAELVFEGRVVATRIDHQPGTRAVHTWVKFEILDVVKGQFDQPYLELSFLGGTSGDISVNVSDMQIPKMGEHGVYFVENTNKAMVNPLRGWDEGHFLVQYDRKLKRQQITTLSGQPVFDVNARAVRGSALKISNGVAKGVITSAPSIQALPLAPAQFKAKIREMAQ